MDDTAEAKSAEERRLRADAIRARYRRGTRRRPGGHRRAQREAVDPMNRDNASLLILGVIAGMALGYTLGAWLTAAECGVLR